MKRKILLSLTLSFFTAFIFANLIPHPAKNGKAKQAAVLSTHPESAVNAGRPIVSNSSATTTLFSMENLPPVARAGSDTMLELPHNTAILDGCTSSDPEMAPLKYKWIKISGPGAFRLSEDSLCFLQVSGLIEGAYSFELTVTDTAGLTGKDTVEITVNSMFANNWPPQVTPLCGRPFKVVVLGSSTAYGTGANPIDSSWVNKFQLYLSQQNAQSSVINLANPGFNSYQVSPTGIVVPPNWSFIVDTNRNITKALSLNPDAIILNLPSNDINAGIPLSEVQFNYNRIQATADSQHVPIWITTTQPRTLSPDKALLQMDLRDWIMNRFGSKAVDFWSTVSNPDGTIKQYFAAGDGMHLNNYGHHVLFTRIVEEKIWDTICIRDNLPPIAVAGNDTTIHGSPAVIILDGSASYDPDGTIVSFNWRILNDTAGSITGANTANPVFSTATPKNYTIELQLTDNLGSITKDTIHITVSLSSTSTYTFTGNGNWNVASNWNNNDIPPAILSGNAMIIIDPVVNGECVLNIQQKIINGAVLKIMDNKKFRVVGGCKIVK